MSGKASGEQNTQKKGKEPETGTVPSDVEQVTPNHADSVESAQSILKAPLGELSNSQVPKAKKAEAGSLELQAVAGPSSRWVSYSAYLYMNPMSGENARTATNDFKVLYTRIYKLQLSESVKADRTATIIREDRGSDLVPFLHLLTVDLLKKADIDDTTRNNVAPDFKGVLANRIDRMLYYARFMKATQLFKMQNFPHLLKNHVENERAYYFGDLRRIENPNEMALNLDMITLADNNILVEVLVPN